MGNKTNSSYASIKVDSLTDSNIFLPENPYRLIDK